MVAIFTPIATEHNSTSRLIIANGFDPFRFVDPERPQFGTAAGLPPTGVASARPRNRTGTNPRESSQDSG